MGEFREWGDFVTILDDDAIVRVQGRAHQTWVAALGHGRRADHYIGGHDATGADTNVI